MCAPRCFRVAGILKRKAMTLEDKIRNALVEFIKEAKIREVEGNDPYTPNPVIHIMYTYKGEFHQTFKHWTFAQAEAVLTLFGATYWAI